MASKGFTIIELMIVVATIAILASLAIPTYQKFQFKAHNAAALAEIHLIVLAENNFYDINSYYADYIPSDRDAEGKLNKIITRNGVSTPFVISYLNSKVESLVKIDPSGSLIIVAARGMGGNYILAIEMDKSLSTRKKLSTTLTPADVPASTGGWDLSSWSDW